MHKTYTNIKYLSEFFLIFLFFMLFWLYFLGGDIFRYCILYVGFFTTSIIYIAIILFVFSNQHVFKVIWDEKKIVFKNLLWGSGKYYSWDSIAEIYYCPKFGVVHLFIATDDGEFYSMPDVSDKLYQALKKYAKVEIKTIRHPMEVLPYLRERRENARKSRKKLSKRR